MLKSAREESLLDLLTQKNIPTPVKLQTSLLLDVKSSKSKTGFLQSHFMETTEIRYNQFLLALSEV
jgi:hypothetical protein